ncbi:glycosyltransferase [Alloprevotella sp. oral taxon 473]|uniref:glycosyltransferase n=1 Tax=Alloprevotella sp. oral taxon 473 TaxID=712469 RepID=UPI0002A2297A|nr:glycosyltransferase [Alloprevotella sp. oral taxon 473]EKX94298.1 glycosyltransferase, group 2 family protein [Alloprevotella sp. oral taxon 473 str. F0040]
MKYSVIVPVYNRPNECEELLESLTHQTQRDFEVIIVEDGSSVPCREVVERYADKLAVQYYDKPNSGPGQTRNYGVERANGEYVIILDSDVVLPEGYFAAIDAELAANPCDAFGGPDRAHESFSTTQKAINYAMTSFFTTGGIRGGKAKLDKFYPRSFNMGVRREVYQALEGFSAMRFGEDIDFSTRIFKSGYRCRLFPEAWVYHKRRTDLKKFFKQVHNSGIARIHLSHRHPGTHKLVHLLPAVFTLGVAFLLVLALLSLCFGCEIGTLVSLSPLLLFALLIGVDATRQSRSLAVGVTAIAAAFVQLTGYGTGYLSAWWRCNVRGEGEFEAFSQTFYQ